MSTEVVETGMEGEEKRIQGGEGPDFLVRIAERANVGNMARFGPEPVRWGDWIVATDGRVLAAIPDDGRETPEGVAWTRSAAGPEALVPDDIHTSVEFPLDTLREWLGEPEPECEACMGGQPPCQHCDGTGYVECTCFDCDHLHEAECDECHGSGGLCETCEGEGVVPMGKISLKLVFGPATINAPRLAHLLQGAPGKSVRLSHGDKDRKAVKVDGEGWWGLVMPLAEFGDYTAPDAPKVELTPEALTRPLPAPPESAVPHPSTDTTDTED